MALDVQGSGGVIGFWGQMGDIVAAIAKTWGKGQDEIDALVHKIQTDQLSQITPDEAQLLAAVYFAQVQFPSLVAPVSQADASLAVAAVSTANPSAVSLTAGIGSNSANAVSASDVATRAAESYSRSVHADSARTNTEYQVSPSHRALVQHVHDMKNDAQADHYANPHTVTSTFAVGTGMVGYVGSSDTTSQSTISYNVTSDSMQQITPLLPGIGDMRAELGLFGALWATGAAYQAAWLTVSSPEKGAKSGNDITFAKNYSDRLIALCNDGGYASFLTVLITQNMEGTSNATSEQMNQWITMVKIGMLLSALALFYKIKPGQTPESVVNLLRPDAEPLPKDDPRAKLVEEIKAQLKKIKDPDQRTAVLANIMQFLGNVKSVKALTDPVSILRGVFEGDESLGLQRQQSDAI